MIYRTLFHGRCVVERRPYISESGVDSMRQCVDFRGLLFTGDDQRSAFVLLEILGDGVEPFFRAWRKCCGTAKTELCC